MSDADIDPGDGDQRDPAPVKLFGDPESATVNRDHVRRLGDGADLGSVPASLVAHENHDDGGPIPVRMVDVGSAVRLGRGDLLATGLQVLGALVFSSSLIVGGLILNNARDVGAFSNPWNSNRVAIGLFVLAFGVIHSAILIGVARSVMLQLAIFRLRRSDVHRPEPAKSPDR